MSEREIVEVTFAVGALLRLGVPLPETVEQARRVVTRVDVQDERGRELTAWLEERR